MAKKKNYTKSEKLVIVVLVYLAIFIQENLLLLAFGRNPMEEAVVVAITAIPVSFIGYLVKSFNGKKQEENMKYKRERYLKQSEYNHNDEDIFDEEDDYNKPFDIDFDSLEP